MTNKAHNGEDSVTRKHILSSAISRDLPLVDMHAEHNSCSHTSFFFHSFRHTIKFKKNAQNA